MLKKLAIAILKREFKKLDPDKVVEVVIALLDEKVREYLPMIIEKLK